MSFGLAGTGDADGKGFERFKVKRINLPWGKWSTRRVSLYGEPVATFMTGNGGRLLRLST